MDIVEVIGYGGSVLIAVSLMMSNLRYLRWINLIGAALLTVYSVINGVIPVAAVNGFIVIIDAYYIWEITRKKDFFSKLAVPVNDDVFLSKFLETYHEDIIKFFPGFNLQEIKEPNCLFVLRNLTPVGLFIYERKGESSAVIHLDYVISSYRDLGNAHFLFKDRLSYFMDKGIKEFIFYHPSVAHLKYLLQVGFTQKASDKNAYIKPL